MDSIEEAIMDSLIQKNGIGFEELITNVKNQTRKTRQTINSRVHVLMEKKLVEKRKRKYYLYSVADTKSDKDFRKKIAELRKRTNKTLKSTSFFRDGPTLSHEIFNEVYLPHLYSKIVLEPFLPKSQVYKIQHELKKCEKMIQDLTVRLQDEGPKGYGKMSVWK